MFEMERVSKGMGDNLKQIVSVIILLLVICWCVLNTGVEYY